MTVSEQLHRSLFVIWQDPESRRWHPVGRLTKNDREYRFEYINGASEAPSFTPFAGMRELDRVFASDTLFPLFANRVIAASRPEYPRVMRWLGLDEEWKDGFEVLARSGGKRKTDTLRLVPSPQRTSSNCYDVLFFSHGIRYLSHNDQARVLELKSGECLFPMHDCQNPEDPNAVLLRTGDPMSFAGYCPRYLADDILKLLKASADPNDIKVVIERANADAPPQMQLLCRVQAPWLEGFEPFSSVEFQPIDANRNLADGGQMVAAL